MSVLKTNLTKQLNLAVPSLVSQLIAPTVVTQVSADAFKGAKGDTVWLKIPGFRAKAREYTFRTRTAPIVFDDITQQGRVGIKLDSHFYSGTTATDEHYTLDDIDFANEVALPQAEALVGSIEAKVLAELRGSSAKHDFTGANAFSQDSDPHLLAVELRRLLDRDRRAPAAGRVFLVGSDVGAAFVASQRLSDYSSTGETGTPAVRESTIGRLAGADVIVHDGLEPNEGYYLHSSCIALASVAPAVPRGVGQGASVVKDNIGMRLIADYDAAYLRDRWISSTFCGTVELRDERGTDGSWIFEDGEYDDDEFAELGVDPGQVKPAGTRKNVHVAKFELSGDGSVLPAA